MAFIVLDGDAIVLVEMQTKHASVSVVPITLTLFVFFRNCMSVSPFVALMVIVGFLLCDS